MKRVLTLLLAVLFVLAVPLGVQAEQADWISQAHETTGSYLMALGDPVPGGLGGEWMVLGLARSGHAIADSYYDAAVSYINDAMDENGRLHATKGTINCRFVVAMTALGKDATNIDGHDLLAGLNDINYIKKVGVTGVIWALLAFDCGNYQTPAGIDRQVLVKTILDWRTTTGGWANSGDVADPDVTAMALQALAPYQENDDHVAQAVEKAVQLLSQMQDEKGNFPSQYGSSSESIAQVVVALSALKIDANEDPRFVKNGVSALDGLLSYYVEEGGFRHILSGKRDGMATEQGYYALTAYQRMKTGETALYDMTDVLQQPQQPQQPQTEEKGNAMLWLWIVAAAGAVLTALCFLLKKKLGKRRFANALMVVAILVAAAVGLGFARYWMPQEQAQLGSLYKITPIAGDRLVTSENAENLCTITIRCDTILDHQKKLEHSKIPYVPSDGVILPTITVEFAPGETVFDVLKRVCEAADILLEYSWTPLYDSYYLEGIGHLYEYDCGTESGWMYQVNGLYPNYGCSSYELQPGDAIGWNYTCVGQGADLGTEGMKKEK